MLTFPCRLTLRNGGRPAECGTPTRAVPCRCARPVMDLEDESCVMCGRLFGFVIERTWATRAHVLAAGGDRVSALRPHVRRGHLPAVAQLV